MDELGLVSVSFRSLTPEQVIAAAKNAGLTCIEWGSDVHAPCHDPARLRQIRAMQEAAGLTCCSYGTYFRIGVNKLEELTAYLDGAALLGTDILRLWCGPKGSDAYTPKEREDLYRQCWELARMARDRGMTLCMECHNDTMTDRKEPALALMEAVDSPAFRMYWQPNQNRTEEENLAYARLLAPYTTHLHVFNWKGPDKYPLTGAVALWRQYRAAFAGDHKLLLEFMPDDRVESLPTETAALRQIEEGRR